MTGVGKIMKETLVGILVLTIFGGLLFGFCMLPGEVFYFCIFGIVAIIALKIILYLAKEIGKEVCCFFKRRKWKGRENER